MHRKELEELGLAKEQLDAVFAAYGKDVEAERAKAEEKTKAAVESAENPLKKQIETLTKQAEEYQLAVKDSAGIDEAAKAKIAELEKTHAAALKEAQKNHEAELLKLRREAETRDFFANLGKTFATPETRKAFEESLNAAMTDKACEGKNRADIFAELIKDADGKERADIFAAGSMAKPVAAGESKGLPGAGVMFTPEQIKAITPEQVNKNWSAIQKTIQGGN